MQVFKIEQPIVAFSFELTAEGNNFAELKKDVAEAGGKVEVVTDTLARVEFGGRTYDLPVGYVLVFDGVARLMGKTEFGKVYIGADGGVVDLDDLVARVERIEQQVGKGGRTAKVVSEKASDEPKTA